MKRSGELGDLDADAKTTLTCFCRGYQEVTRGRHATQVHFCIILWPSLV
jgi:hypothetical protein